MDGIHDMGGMDGFGRVVPESQPKRGKSVFHEPWEARVHAMNRAMAATGAWNIDMARFAKEKLPPHIYLTATYYQKWLLGLEQMLLERGLVDADELAAGHALRPGKTLKRGALQAADADRMTNRGNFARPTNTEAKFRIGDRVRAKNIHPQSHTRLPRYVRGRTGVVDLIHGTHVFPDSAAAGDGDNPQWLYTVVFEGRELWGPGADPATKISIDAFEPYLEATQSDFMDRETCEASL